MSYVKKPEGFRHSKIPTELHTTIWGWRCLGVTLDDMRKRLAADHNLTVSVKPIRKIIYEMGEDKQKLVGSVLVDKAVSDIQEDYANLDLMEERLERFMVTALDSKDIMLGLKIIDRQKSITALKLGIASNNKGTGDEDNREALLESLLGKMSGRKE